MKIRTITAGVNVHAPAAGDLIRRAGRFLAQARTIFEQAGYEVQSVRLSTQAWPITRASDKPSRIAHQVREWEKLVTDCGIDFASIGTVQEPAKINLIPEIIAATSIISASATIAARRVYREAVLACSRTIIKISQSTPQGYGNFRFAAIANCPPGIPFYPASYHQGPPGFSLGLENSDLLVRAFGNARSFFEAGARLAEVLRKELRPLVRIGSRLGKNNFFRFLGLDVSIAPSLKRRESLALACERLGLGRFGEPGTLAVSSLITKTLSLLKMKTCGYRGLMLPILEDWGLARRYAEGLLDVPALLSFSAVCGTGLDCLPLPGDTSLKKINALLLDVAALAVKLNKPLSARLLPVPGRSPGDMSAFCSPYLIDTKIQGL